MVNQKTNAKAPEWFREIKRFEQPSVLRAVWQIVNTFVPLVVLWVAMAWLVRTGQPYWITAILLVPAGLLMVRLFIFFHDCTHGSFFKNSTANAIVGGIFGVLTFTAYEDWRKSHSIHHATNANLDKRGVGDIWTLTLEEYKASKPSVRFWYRVYRNPIVLFLIIPPVLFLFIQRFPNKKFDNKNKWNTYLTNVGVLAVVLAIGFFGGWDLLLLVHIPLFYVASIAGVWLFYVQHQFDPSYWEHEDEWNSYDAAMLGSSHYKLPKILQWFSGNIGFHHIHHLKPRIPNYNLERCYKAIKELQLPDPLTVWRSIKCVNLHIWDENEKVLISFRQAHKAMKRLALLKPSLEKV